MPTDRPESKQGLRYHSPAIKPSHYAFARPREPEAILEPAPYGDFTAGCERACCRIDEATGGLLTNLLSRIIDRRLSY
ncbi:hypothetical protein NDR87_33710 [Nocardia sp. CDC159]|uniref:Uncharacterized protein n=1 Tax=Nocardia pulmonis TaxID=2951408 RepID=A0A9X2ECR8_9NOCA|nr:MULTISPECIES: hypothetical protein [Nocardia]MCM6778454.1 hypothetical protein [Nocardia pulmonis]MCM6791343.1 hypothetical protein [Nocardia sp. CDC159]